MQITRKVLGHSCTRWKVVALIKVKTSPLRGYPPLVQKKKKETNIVIKRIFSITDTGNEIKIEGN